MNITRTLNGKPITIVGVISALHSIIYGIGFTFEFGGFQQTVLYENISMVSDPTRFGLIILLAGVAVLAGLLTDRRRIIALSSSLQSLCWLFTFFAYALNGQVLLGLGIAFVWTMLSSYVAYVHANRDHVVAEVLRSYRDRS